MKKGGGGLFAYHRRVNTAAEVINLGKREAILLYLKMLPIYKFPCRFVYFRMNTSTSATIKYILSSRTKKLINTNHIDATCRLQINDNTHFDPLKKTNFSSPFSNQSTYKTRPYKDALKFEHFTVYHQ